MATTLAGGAAGTGCAGHAHGRDLGLCCDQAHSGLPLFRLLCLLFFLLLLLPLACFSLPLCWRARAWMHVRVHVCAVHLWVIASVCHTVSVCHTDDVRLHRTQTCTLMHRNTQYTIAHTHTHPVYADHGNEHTRDRTRRAYSRSCKIRQKETTSPPPLASRRHDVRLTRDAPRSPQASRLGCLSVYAVKRPNKE